MMKTSHALMRTWYLAVTALVLLTALIAAPALPLISAPLAAGADLVWHVFGAGGGHAESGAYSMDATLGQPISAVSTGASTQLSAGFWQSGFQVFVPLVFR